MIDNGYINARCAQHKGHGGQRSISLIYKLPVIATHDTNKATYGAISPSIFNIIKKL